MPKKLMDCVDKVEGQGHSESSAFAICVDSTGLSPHKEEKSTMNVDTKEMIEEHKKLIDVLNSPSHKDDKKEAKKQSKELEEYEVLDKADGSMGATGEMQGIDQGMFAKSDYVDAAFIPMRGASSVDMEVHRDAARDENAKPMLEYLKRNIGLHSYGLTDKYDTFELPILTDRGDWVLAGFCKEPGFYSGTVRPLFGETAQEFENDTLEMIASMLTVRIGNVIVPPEPMVALNVPVFEPEDALIKDEIKAIPELEKPKEMEQEDKKPKIEIEVEDNKVTITLFKSKESEMGLGDELKKAFGKPEDKKPAAKKPEAKKPDAKDEQPAAAADESDDVLSPVDEKVGPDLGTSNKKQMPANPKAANGNKNSQKEANRRQAPIGGDDDDSLPGANLGGNTGGVQAQDGAEGMEQEMMDENGMPIMDNHEYIKMTQHAAGKQFWYRDPATGQIIEKENAPEGHPDFDHGQMMSDVLMKLEHMQSQLDQLLGEEASGGLEMEGMEGEEEPMMGEDGQPMAPSETDPASLEDEEEVLGDLDGDGEVGEDPEHQEAVAAAEAGQPAPAAKKPAPKAPAAKKPDMDKMKKSLKAKYPHLSDEKIAEVLKKATPPADVAHSKDGSLTEAGDGASATEGDIGPMGENKGDSDEGNTKTKKKDIKEEPDNSGPPHGEPGNKQGNSHEAIRKSKFDRMWRIFKIDMPEKLEKSEDFTKANDGLKKLQKCIMRQGKSEAEANKVVNRAVVEKYNLSKGSRYIAKSDANVNVDNEGQRSLEEMQALRKSDADGRFGIPEYTGSQEALVVQKSTSINEQIKEIMNPSGPIWDYKEFNGTDVKKSQPTQHEQDLQKAQDARWNMPEWKGSERDIKEMVIAKSQSINERIEKASKVDNVTFEKYKTYDEAKTKLEKSQKTDSELMQEAIIKKNWKE